MKLRLLARARLVSVVLLGTMVLAPSHARADAEVAAQQLPVRNVTFTWDKGFLRTTFSVRDAMDPEIAKKLSSGIAAVVALRVYAFRDGAEAPVALAVRTCRVAYDVWDEVYRIKLSVGGEEKNLAVLNLEGVARTCFDAKDLAVLAEKSIDLRPHFLGVLFEVNPVSAQTVEQMRRWVARPSGPSGIGPGDALFGSFVGLFVRQIGASDKTVRFRTTSIPAPPPPAP